MLFMCYTRSFAVPDGIILLIHVSAEMEMCVVAHDDFRWKIVFLVVEVQDGLIVGYLRWAVNG